MIPTLTPEVFVIASTIAGVVGIVLFLIRKGKALCAGDVVAIMTIFDSAVGFIYSGCQIWYIVLSNQNLGALKNIGFHFWPEESQ